MRVAALYDIHGNLPALDAVLADVKLRGVDHVVIGGDVLPGPMPRECLDRLLTFDLPTSFVSGNGEREVLAIKRGVDTGAVPAAFRPMMQWVGEQLTGDHERRIGAWPATLRMPIAELGDVLFCHATPRSDSEIFLRTTPNEALLAIFDAAKADIVVCGHTHMQFDRRIGRTRVVNAGSVGMPFGEPGAYWLLLDSEPRLQHTSYDLAGAADAIRGTAYPQSEDFATRSILRPPTEQQMLDLYSRAEIKAT